MGSRLQGSGVSRLAGALWMIQRLWGVQKCFVSLVFFQASGVKGSELWAESKRALPRLDEKYLPEYSGGVRLHGGYSGGVRLHGGLTEKTLQNM